MFSKFKTLIAGQFIVACGISMAMADMVPITIHDGEDGRNMVSGSWQDVVNRTSGVREDNEVEGECVYEQRWDLEGVFLDGGKLTMVGGYNFTSGEYSADWKTTFASGDLFIDINGDAIYGAEAAKIVTEKGNYDNSEVANSFGYDYVLDFNDDFTTYQIIEITSSSVLTWDSYFDVNNNANPWRYKSGGTLKGTGTVTKSTLTDAESGFTGGFHNAVTMDISFLDGKEITTHFTMGCGNDNLMGKGTVNVPEPSVFMLLGAGFGFLGLAVRRKK